MPLRTTFEGPFPSSQPPYLPSAAAFLVCWLDLQFFSSISNPSSCVACMLASTTVWNQLGCWETEDRPNQSVAGSRMDENSFMYGLYRPSWEFKHKRGWALDYGCMEQVTRMCSRRLMRNGQYFRWCRFPMDRGLGTLRSTLRF